MVVAAYCLLCSTEFIQATFVNLDLRRFQMLPKVIIKNYEIFLPFSLFSTMVGFHVERIQKFDENISENEILKLPETIRLFQQNVYLKFPKFKYFL